MISVDSSLLPTSAVPTAIEGSTVASTATSIAPAAAGSPLAADFDSSGSFSSSSSAATASSTTSSSSSYIGSCLMILPVSRVAFMPFVALACELKKINFRVGVCAPENLEQTTKSFGVFDAFYAIKYPYDELARSFAFKKACFDGSLLDQVQVEASLQNYAETNWRKEVDAARDFDATLLVCCEHSIAETLCIGQANNMPTFICAHRPCIPSAALPPIGVQPPAVFNKLLHSLSQQYKAADISDKIARFRFKLGLHDTLSSDYHHIPQCLMLSELFLPRPADYGKLVHMTGFLTLQPELLAKYEPPAALWTFLIDDDKSASADDARPFFVGLGVMPTPDEFVGSVLAAATTLKRRVVLCGAFTSDLRDKAPPHAIVLDDEPPLEWLLTRCRGAVLCGEPARVGVALTVGCPVIALPVTTTQRFVAARLVALGVPAAAGQSDGVLMLKDANATAITALLTALDEPARRTSAHTLAAQLQAELASLNAAKFVETTYATQRHCGVRMGANGWVPDESSDSCTTCKARFGFLLRRHHCRSCGMLHCGDCLALDSVPSYNEPVPVCRMCFEARAALRETGVVVAQIHQ